jgi:hypothetical protein
MGAPGKSVDVGTICLDGVELAGGIEDSLVVGGVLQ